MIAFRLIKDRLSQIFGFGTQKERIDAQLEKYKFKEINYINLEIAERNQLITLLSGKIDYYKRILDNNVNILNLYNTILEKSELEVLKDNSDINIVLYNPDNSYCVKGNISILKKILMHKDFKNNFDFYIKQLESQVELTVNYFIDNLVQNKGFYIINGVNIDEREIYNLYNELKQLVILKGLMNNGEPFDKIKDGISFLNIVKKICEENISNVNFVLQKLYICKKQLDNQNLSGKFVLETIENAKRLITVSEEYNIAQASHEYLEQINKNR